LQPSVIAISSEREGAESAARWRFGHGGIVAGGRASLAAPVYHLVDTPPSPRYAIPPYLRTKDLRGTPYLSAYLVIPAPYPGKSSGASGVSGAREDCRLGAVLG
jgi:hypothetical protein